MMNITLLAAALASISAPAAHIATPVPTAASVPAIVGQAWVVRTSLGFDALCALNILSGDPYYTSRYPEETRMFADRRYDASRIAARAIKARIKDQDKGIVSAALVLIFSGGPDASLDDLLASARAPGGLERSFRASRQWDQKSWDGFVATRGSVIAALEGMRRAGFEAWWRNNVLPETERRSRELSAELGKYDITAEQRRLMGSSFGTPGLEVVLLHFSKPHGISIQGGRYLLNVGYPLHIVLRGGAHEPFHPPFDMADAAVAAAVARVARGATVSWVAGHHDASFGYNSVEGLVDEDCTQALEQVVSDRLGFADAPRQRWAEDDGMHLLAAAVYQAMRETGFVATGGRFRDWLVDMAARGELDDEAVRRRAAAVLGPEAVAKWTPASGG